MEEIQKDLKLHQAPPFNLRHHQAKEETNVYKPKRKISFSLPAVLVSLFIVIVTIAALGTIFYSKQTQTKIASINNFEDCVAAGNPVMESYPEQCAANGQTFTRVLTEEEQKKLSPDPTADWKTYEGKGFSFEYPSDWEADGDNQLSKSVKYEGEPVYGDVTPGWAEVQIGSIEKLSKEKNYQNSEFSGISEESEVTINGHKALKATGSTGIGGSVYYHAYFIEKDPSSSVMITMITQDQKLEEAFIKDFDQILSTFKFTDQNSAVDTSDWKTYDGETFYSDDGSSRFTIKYPADWYLEDNYLYPMGKDSKQKSYNGSDIRITLGASGNGVMVSNQQKNFPAGTFNYSWENEGAKFASLSKNNIAYIFLVQGLFGKDEEKYEEIFNQMLSTLQITE